MILKNNFFQPRIKAEDFSLSFDDLFDAILKPLHTFRLLLNNPITLNSLRKIQVNFLLVKVVGNDVKLIVLHRRVLNS